MRQLPKAIPELDGGLFLPRPVVELLEAVLLAHEQSLRACARPSGADLALDLTVLTELRQLLRLTGMRLPLPPARELLGLSDPREQMVARNLLRGR